MPAASTVYPIADNVSIAGDWTPSSGANCYSRIAEVGAADDDTTYIQRDANLAGTGLNNAVKLGAVTDPGIDAGFVSTVRCKRSAGLPGTITLNCALYQGNPDAGGTLLEAWAPTITATAYGDKTKAWADATIAAISDFTDLWMMLTATTSGGSRTARVTQVKLDVPASPAAYVGGALSMVGAQ